MPEVKFGRKPPKNAPALRFASFRTAAVPTHPVSEDYGQDFRAWQMLGNDQYGDCVAVTWANQRALVTTALTGTTDYPTQDEVFAFYETQNPGFPTQDDGMDIQTALEYLVKSGGPDGVKAVAFAKVDFTNRDELTAAHAIFGQVWYGVNVLDANMTEFNQGKPWDYVAHSQLDGGHSVTGVGYDANNIRFITWAEETAFTEAFRTHQVEEAWVVIWPEHLGSKAFLAGVDETALAADYQAITGKPFPVQPTPQPVPPAPSPTPVPTPTPAPVDAATLAMWAKVGPWTRLRHVGVNHDTAQELITWATAEGLPTGAHIPEHEAR